jgi:DNA polymerase III delta subunit
MKSSPARSRAGKAGAGEPPARAARATKRPAARPTAAVDAATLLSRFDRDDFPGTLYVEGPSEPLKAALLGELRRAWARAVPESPLASVKRAAESGPDEILAAYQSASLFTPRDLVIVLDIEDLGRSEKRVAALAAGLAHPAGTSSLVLVESASDSGRKTLDPLRAACAERWIAMPPGRPELARWGERRLAREGVTAEKGVLESVLDACEGDALSFFNELDKLCAFAGPDGRIGRAEADAFLRPLVGADLADYLAAVAMGDARLGCQRLGRLLAAGVGEGQILFALSNLVGGALGGWARWRDLSMTLARRLGPRLLARALDALYRAEAAWKGGRADVVAVLEQATRAIAGSKA